MRRLLLLTAGAVGLAIGIRWAMLTPPHPNCGGDGVCELQRIYAAQLTKIAACVVATYAIVTWISVTLPEGLWRRARDRRGREWAAEQREAAAAARVTLADAAARARLAHAAVPALPPAALAAARRHGPALRPRGSALKATPVPRRAAAAPLPATPAPDASLSLPPAALRALARLESEPAPPKLAFIVGVRDASPAVRHRTL